MTPTKKQIAQTKKWVRNRADELAVSQNMFFDAARGQFVCDWVEANCWLFEGKNEPVRLLPWHRDLIMRMFSWVRFSEFHDKWIRRFTITTVFAAKKNAKSPLIAFIGLYMLYGDAEEGPKICIAATKIDQAALSHKHAVKTVEKSPALKEVCKIVGIHKFIVCESRSGIMQPIANDDKGSEGLNANMLCVDELHVIDSNFADTLKGMTIQRTEPITLRISTAGDDPDSYGYSEYLQGKLEAVSPQPPLHKLFVDYSAPQDVTNEQLENDLEKFARMANPAYGELINPEELRRDYDDCKSSPAKLASFKRYRLGVWNLQAGTPLINPADWAACTWKDAEDLFWAKYSKCPCFLGLDFATINDFVSANFGLPLDGLLGMHFLLWMPEKTIFRHAKRKAEFAEWYKNGFIRKGGDEVIDQSFIQRDIVEVVKPHGLNVREIIFDPAFAPQNVQQLQRGIVVKGETVIEGIGGKLVELRQSYGDLTRPIADLESLCVSHSIETLFNPCVAWQIGNVQAKEDGYGGRRIDKTDSWRKIDAASASLCAVARALRVAKTPSVSFFQSPVA